MINIFFNFYNSPLILILVWFIFMFLTLSITFFQNANHTKRIGKICQWEHDFNSLAQRKNGKEINCKR